MSIISKEHKTPSLRKEDIKKEWFLIDAKGKTLGRLATEVARRLRGKHKPTFTPNQDCGDGIIVINAAEVNVTGNKRQDKIYYHHSRYPGGMKETTFDVMIQKNPTKVIMEAVTGMLPKSRLGSAMLTHCRVFAGEKHNLESQKPTKLEI
jgi:large subunit ribosomal protein L13